MTITEHKRLIAAIPEDLMDGEEVEVLNVRGEWQKEKFAIYCMPRSLGYAVGVMDQNGMTWPYARRPASALKTDAPHPVKKLKNEPKRLFSVIDTATGSDVTEDLAAVSYAISFVSVSGKKASCILATPDGELCMEDSCGETHSLPERFKAVIGYGHNSLEERPKEKVIIGNPVKGENTKVCTSCKFYQADPTSYHCVICSKGDRWVPQWPSINREDAKEILQKLNSEKEIPENSYFNPADEDEDYNPTLNSLEPRTEKGAYRQLLMGVREVFDGEEWVKIGDSPTCKKYRPWRDPSEVPAPLMIRLKVWSGAWAYAMPMEDDGTGLRFFISDGFDGSIRMSAYDLFERAVQHDGKPCGVEERGKE